MTEKEDKKIKIYSLKSLRAPYIELKKKHRGPIRLSRFLNTNILFNGGLGSNSYAFPSETNVGKSALMQNFCEAAEESGCHVLFIGLEMSMDEYIDRGISSMSYRMHMNNNDVKPYPFSEIDDESEEYDMKCNEFKSLRYEQYEKAAEAYFDAYGENMHFVKAEKGKITVDDINEIIKTNKKFLPDARFMVVIDYLQIIRNNPDDKSSQSDDALSLIASELQNIAISEKVPILFPSSVPKSACGQRKDSTSMKGTADAAYSAGVILPYEWLGVTFCIDKGLIFEEKQKCNKRGYRIMWLAQEKARKAQNGAPGVFYKYFPAFNYIEEVEYTDIKDEYGYLFQPQSDISEKKFTDKNIKAIVSELTKNKTYCNTIINVIFENKQFMDKLTAFISERNHSAEPVQMELNLKEQPRDSAYQTSNGCSQEITEADLDNKQELENKHNHNYDSAGTYPQMHMEL